MKDDEKSLESQDYGKRSQEKITEKSLDQSDYIEYIDALYGSGDFYTDTSEIEKALLANIPGVSRHLDDSHDHINDYYTVWDDPIYDQFKDYVDVVDVEDVPEDSIPEEDRSSQFVSKVNENLKLDPKTKENILLDHTLHSKKPERSAPTNLRPGDPAVSCDPSKCQLPDCRQVNHDTLNLKS